MTEAAGRNRSWGKWLAAIVLLVAIAFVFLGLFRRPKLVTVVRPQRISLTETIASSARVGGVQETAVGAQFSGTVEHLFVKLGDRVKAGQPIARLKNDVTQQQTTQAKVAVDTARARLAQVSRSPLPSEIDEAVHQVNEAKAQVAQARTDLDLAAKEFERNRQLYQQGLIPKNEFEKAESNRNSLEARLRTARATVKARQARLETLEHGPVAEDVEVARAQLAEANQALVVAEHQSKEATIIAPFAGVITALNAQEGQTVGSNGVVSLVSDDLEIRVDLDENNLADLELGQRAVLSSSAFGGKSFDGKLTDIGAAVDEARGIVTVKITPDHPPDWLRPGQTVNVNLVTNEQVDRLVVPPSALVRQGSRSVVRVVENGHVEEQPVITRPAVPQGIPVGAGLSESDDVIVDGGNVKVGQAVRVKRQSQ
ncbi:MAG TPA: efflux RND transporter periplasmic adaptor subunit [Terriglobales bacterium]